MPSLVEMTADLRRRIKAGESPAARFVLRTARAARGWSMPVIPGLHSGLYAFHRAAASGISNAKRVLWFTPLFQSRLEAPAPRLFLYDGFPMIQGNVRIRIGADCRVGGLLDISGRPSTTPTPELVIGDNCDIGWGGVLSVGRRITIGNNVRLAAFVHLAGYPGHPTDAAARARGEPDTDDQIGDIVLEDDVWLATGVRVMRGVTIGRGSIVAAGSVVTSDIPPFMLAGGVPARVIRPLSNNGPPAASTTSPQTTAAA